MPPVTVSTDIDRPAAEVFSYATDPTRFHEWQQGVVSGRHVPAAADGTPERCLTVRRIGLADRANTSDVVHSEPPRSWRIRGIDGPIRAQVGVDVDELTPARSRLTVSVDFDGYGIGRLLVPLASFPGPARRCRPTSPPSKSASKPGRPPSQALRQPANGLVRGAARRAVSICAYEAQVLPAVLAVLRARALYIPDRQSVSDSETG